MLKLLAPFAKKSPNLQNLGDSDCEAENTFTASKSTPIKPKAPTQKNTLLASREMVIGVLNDCTNMDTKRSQSQSATSRLLFAFQQ